MSLSWWKSCYVVPCFCYLGLLHISFIRAFEHLPSLVAYHEISQSWRQIEFITRGRKFFSSRRQWVPSQYVYLYAIQPIKSASKMFSVLPLAGKQLVGWNVKRKHAAVNWQWTKRNEKLLLLKLSRNPLLYFSAKYTVYPVKRWKIEAIRKNEKGSYIWAVTMYLSYWSDLMCKISHLMFLSIERRLEDV